MRSSWLMVYFCPNGPSTSSQYTTQMQKALSFASAGGGRILRRLRFIKKLLVLSLHHTHGKPAQGLPPALSPLAFSYAMTVIGTWTGTTRDVEAGLVYCYDNTETSRQTLRHCVRLTVCRDNVHSRTIREEAGTWPECLESKTLCRQSCMI